MVVNIIVGDEPSENRGTMKSIATLSIEGVIEFHLKNNLRKLSPINMEIAFRHPLRNAILIFYWRWYVTSC